MTFNVKLEWKNERVLRNLPSIESRAKTNMHIVNQQIAPLVVETARLYQGGNHPGGPRKITGAFQAATKLLNVWHTGFSFGNDSPQAKRLEYGFVGRDVLGREFNQPPYATMRPAMWLWKGAWQRRMLKAAVRAVFKR